MARYLRRATVVAPIVFAAAVLVASCFENTGPALLTGRFALAPAFESAASGIVSIEKFRVTLHRTSDGGLALDTVIPISPGADSVDLGLTVRMLTSSETFTLTLALITPAGDTAFRAGPVTVRPDAGGAPPAPVPLVMHYTGVGANAQSVRIVTASPRVFFGDTTTLAAEAVDSGGNPIPGTPIAWASLDTARAAVPDPALGRVRGGSQRGQARITAALLTGPADTAIVLVQPTPARMAVAAGDNQSGQVATALASPLQFQVKAADSLGVGGLAVRFAVASGGGALSLDSGLTDDSGRVNVQWTLGPTAGAQSIRARIQAPIPDSVVTASAVALAGPPDSLAVNDGDGQTAVAGVAVATAPSVVVRDSLHNLVPGATVTFQVTGGGGSLTGSTPVTDSLGVARVGSWTLGTAVGGNALRALVVRGPGDTLSVSFGATAVAAAAASLTVSGIASPITAGAAGTVTVTAKDAFGNVATGYRGTVHFTSTDTGALLPADYTFVAGDSGVHGFGVTLAVAGSQSVTATDLVTSSITGSQAVTVQPGAPSARTSVITVSSGTVLSGGAVMLTLQAKDSLGNSLTTGGATVVFGASGGTSAGTIGATTDNGNGSYAATFTAVTAGTATTIGATVNGVAVSTALPTITVAPGVASPATSTVSVSSGTVASGSSVTLTLQSKDAAGNNLTAGGLTVLFSASGGTSTGTIGATTDNGDGTYGATFTGVTAGTATTIGATINGTAVTSTLPTVTVTPGAASPATSTVSTSGGTVVAGNTVTLTLQAKDAAGNNLTAGGLTVLFSAAGGTSTGNISATTDHGDGTYTATFTGVLAGTPTTIHATINSNPVTTTLPTIIVTPGAISASTSVVSVSSTSVVSGGTVTLRLQGKDALGNNLTTGGATVVFTGGGSIGTIGATTDSLNGVYTATFTGVTVGTATIGATINAATVTTALPQITVAAGAAATLAFTAGPANTTVNTAISPLQVTAQDAAGNTAISFQGPVTLSLGNNPAGGSLSGTATANALNGVATFTGVSITIVGSRYALQASATGLTPATSQQFIVTPANVTYLWTGAVSADWATTGNWQSSIGSLPAAGDAVFVPVSAANQPTVSALDSVGSVYIEDGATLTLGVGDTLVVGHDVIAGNTIAGSGAIRITGQGTLSGTVPNLVIADSVALIGATTVTGSLSVTRGMFAGQFDLNGYSLHVSGPLDVTGAGSRVIMQQATDTLIVAGNVTFDGGSESGLLTNGVLSVGGDFSQLATNAPSSFAASGAHVTQFNGSTTQAISLASAAAGFANIEITKTAGTVTIGSSAADTLRVSGYLKGGSVPLAGPGVVTLTGTGQTLRGAIPTAVVTGSYSADSAVSVTGDLHIRGAAGNLDLGGHPVNVSGTFGTDSTSNGTLTMTNAADTLDVTGDMTFGGGNTTGLLTAGVILARGNFTQVGIVHSTGCGAFSAIDTVESFKATGTHRIEFIGTATQQVGMRTPGPSLNQTGILSACDIYPGGSQFNNLRINNASGVTFTAGVVAAGNLTVQSGNVGATGQRVSVGGNLSTAGDLTARILEVGDTLTFGAGTYTVNNSVFVGPVDAVPRSLPYDTLQLIGSGATTWTGALNLTGTLVVSGTVHLQLGANATVQDAVIQDSGLVTLGGYKLAMPTAIGNFQTHDHGAIEMTNPADSLIVGGFAAFQGGSTDGLLTAGTIVVTNQLLQWSSASRTSFRPSGTNTVVLTGEFGGQEVFFAAPGDVLPDGTYAFGDSRFQNLEVSNPNGLYLGSDVYVAGTLTVTGGGITDDSAGVSLGRTLRTLDLTAPSLIVGQLDVSGALSVSGGYNVATTTFSGTGQTIPLLPYQNLTVNGTASLASPTAVSGDLVVGSSGQQLDLGGNQLTVSGNVDGGNTVVGPGTVLMTGSGVTLKGTVADLRVTGDVALGANATVQGKAKVVSGTGNLSVGAFTLAVADSFIVDTSATLTMIDPAGTLGAKDVVFRGGNTNTKLTAGLITVSGNFVQAGTDTNAFAPSGTQRVKFIGTGAQQVTFSSLSYAFPGGVKSHFQDLEIAGGAAATTTFASNQYVHGSLTVSSGTLDLGSSTVTVDGDFGTSGTGTLVMQGTVAAPTMTVKGNASFGGGSTAGQLTAGTLNVAGNFTQSGDPNSFAASGSHMVTLNATGASAQTVTFTDPSVSHFNNLTLNTGSGGVVMPDSVVVNGTNGLTVSAGSLSGTGTVTVPYGTFYLDVGTSVTIATARIGYSLTDASSGGFSPSLTEVLGTGVSLPGGPAYQNVLITGQNAVLSGNDMVFNGYLMIDGGNLDMNDAWCNTCPGPGLTVTGDLTVQNGGNLRMVLGETLEVLGNATFAGSDEVDSLSSGTLRLHGNFTQSTNGLAFAPATGFTVAFVGTGTTQQVFFSNPSTSHFGDLLVSQGVAGPAVKLASEVDAVGNLIVPGDTAGRQTIVGSGNVLQVGGFDVSRLTLDDALLVWADSGAFSSGTFTKLDSLTFSANYLTSDIQFHVYHARLATSTQFGMTNLVWLTQATLGGGRYIKAEEYGGNLYPLNLNLGWLQIGKNLPAGETCGGAETNGFDTFNTTVLFSCS